MRFLKFLDKKLSWKQQKDYLFFYLMFGLPFGYLGGQGISIWINGWNTYHFDIHGVIFQIVFGLLISTPLIINYFHHIKKYKLIIKRYLDDEADNLRFHLRWKPSIYKVKCIIDYKEFVKNESYELQIIDNGVKKAKYSMMVINNKGWSYDLKDFINKFEMIDTIKEERKKKLKRLQKL